MCFSILFIKVQKIYFIYQTKDLSKHKKPNYFELQVEKTVLL